MADARGCRVPDGDRTTPRRAPLQPAAPTRGTRERARPGSASPASGLHGHPVAVTGSWDAPARADVSIGSDLPRGSSPRGPPPPPRPCGSPTSNDRSPGSGRSRALGRRLASRPQEALRDSHLGRTRHLLPGAGPSAQGLQLRSRSPPGPLHPHRRRHRTPQGLFGPSGGIRPPAPGPPRTYGS